jgi:hypothetical protein
MQMKSILGHELALDLLHSHNWTCEEAINFPRVLYHGPPFENYIEIDCFPRHFLFQVFGASYLLHSSSILSMQFNYLMIFIKIFPMPCHTLQLKLLWVVVIESQSVNLISGVSFGRNF